MSEAIIKVSGKTFTGWTEVRVRRSMEAIAGAFELALTDRFSESGETWTLRPGDPCEITLEGQTAVTGYLDAVRCRLEADSRALTVGGRDRAADLVDCSAPDEPGQFKGLTLLALATKLCAPFGIPVRATAQVGGPFKSWTVQPGETAFECLERAARQRGVLLTSDGRGGLILGGPSFMRATTSIVEGENLRSAELELNASGRFADYVVKGQSSDLDEGWDSNRAGVRGTAKDAGARAGRKLVIIAEGIVDPATARKRAQWEATVRASRALSLSASVQGWTQGSGRLWQIGELVELSAPSVGASGVFLITETVFSQSSSDGTMTTLALKHKDAFVPEPEVKKKRSDEVGWGWEEGLSLPGGKLSRPRNNSRGLVK